MNIAHHQSGEKVREEMFIFHCMGIQILPSNNSCFVYMQVFQVRVRGMCALCSQLEIWKGSQPMQTMFIVRAEYRTSQYMKTNYAQLARSKGRDLSRTLIKCYYLTYMYIYKFIYYISYDGRHFSSNKKKYSINFFFGRWRGNCV